MSSNSSSSPLSGKQIIVGVTGGIAAYKSALLIRLLVKAGAEVQPIMTPSAKEFITPLTLSTLSGHAVISEFFTANTGVWNSHVDLGLWADAMIIAPATACTIAKMANGVADNMLVTSYLSARSQVFVAPAMDFDMMKHPSTTANIEKLRSYGNIIIEAEEGELASHLVGKGRMAEPDHIVSVVEKHFSAGGDLAGKHVLITAGPTVERIDPVRFISNFSTGKMGYALAEEAARRGASVTLVSGPVALKATNPAIRVVDVESARQMLGACVDAFAQSDVAIMCAAVADYAPAEVRDRKIKRESEKFEAIELRPNPDIAATLGAMKRPGQVLVGFALETDHAEEHGRDKLARKHLDMIVVNSLAVPGAGFGVDTNCVTIIKADGERYDYTTKPKTEVARDILDVVATVTDK